MSKYNSSNQFGYNDYSDRMRWLHYIVSGKMRPTIPLICRG